jgi:hypothetical protein
LATEKFGARAAKRIKKERKASVNFLSRLIIFILAKLLINC